MYSEMSVTLRKEYPEDEPFLSNLYSSIRLDELTALDWTMSQKEMFLKMQFNAKKQYYKNQFPDADRNIILFNNQSIGIIMVIKSDNEVRLMDIALLPEFQNLGIGTALIQDIISEANETGKSVLLHVQKNSRAIRLYERLGFARISDTEFYFAMRWSPSNKV